MGVKQVVCFSLSFLSTFITFFHFFALHTRKRGTTYDGEEEEKSWILLVESASQRGKEKGERKRLGKTRHQVYSVFSQSVYSFTLFSVLHTNPLSPTNSQYQLIRLKYTRGVRILTPMLKPDAYSVYLLPMLTPRNRLKQPKIADSVADVDNAIIQYLLSC